MPPRGGSRGGRGGKKSHNRGRGRRIASFEEVAARNAQFERIEKDSGGDELNNESSCDSESENNSKGDGKKSVKFGDETCVNQDENSHGDESEDDEESSQSQDTTNKGPGIIPISNPNRNKSANIDKFGVTELSRRQKEELLHQQRQRKLEALQAAGKTFQAKNDLARLAEVKKRREQAAKKREEELKLKEEELNKKMSKIGLGSTSTKNLFGN